MTKKEQGKIVIICPQEGCGQRLRVPKVSGTMNVTCATCGTVFKFRYEGASTRRPKWLFSRATVILTLIYYSPAGLVLMWLSPRFRRSAKVLISIFLGLVYIGSVISEVYYNSSQYFSKPTAELIYDMVRQEKDPILLPMASVDSLRGVTVAVGRHEGIFSTTEIARVADKAVAVIETLDRYGRVLSGGSGFNISPQGIVVTNYHVLEGAVRATVKIEDKVYDDVRLVAGDIKKDLALVSVQGKDLPYIRLGDSLLIEKGERVVAVGNPLGFERTVSEGIISGIRMDETGLKLLQITTPIAEGSSGGPLFDMSGRVIGITTLKVLLGQNLNIAVPVEYVKEMVKQLGMITSVQKTYEVGFVEEFERKYSPKTDLEEKARPVPRKKALTEEELEETRTRRGENEANSWLQVGDNFADVGMYDLAIEYYQKVINKYPESKQAKEARKALTKIGAQR